MKLTVTLNTELSEYNDIEVDVPEGSSIATIISEATQQTYEHVSEITSFVIVGVTGNAEAAT